MTAETFSTRVSGLILARDVVCVACGMPGAERHHRRRKRVNHDGLAHSAANGIRLCGRGNVSGCHGRVHSRPTWAREHGYIVLPEQDPREVPMWHYSRGWILLDADGGWAPVSGSRPSPQRMDDPRA